MSIYGGPDIITSGLVLYLDAANTKSYSGSGTAWNDLSGNNSGGTLTNGPTYSSANGGSIVLDGTNDYVAGNSTISIPGTVTVSAWIRHNTFTSSQKRYVTLQNETAVIRQNFAAGQLHFYVTTSSTIKSITVSNALANNTWYHIVGTWDGTNMRLYQNAALVGSSTPGGTMATASVSYAVGAAVGGLEYMSGNISQVAIYNRGLTASEVLQNYNATKGRFGL
jgi:hypothetical protein